MRALAMSLSDMPPARSPRPARRAYCARQTTLARRTKSAGTVHAAHSCSRRLRARLRAGLRTRGSIMRSLTRSPGVRPTSCMPPSMSGPSGPTARQTPWRRRVGKRHIINMIQIPPRALPYYAAQYRLAHVDRMLGAQLLTAEAAYALVQIGLGIWRQRNGLGRTRALA